MFRLLHWVKGCGSHTTLATPYLLVYDIEAVIPLKWQIPSLRIAIQERLTNEENAQLRLKELKALDEKRLEAQQHLECYQVRLLRAFNKNVKPRSFQQGDLVLAIQRPINTLHKIGNKFTSKWDGPYVVQEVYTNDAYKIVDKDGIRVGPINARFLKRYYAWSSKVPPQQEPKLPTLTLHWYLMFSHYLWMCYQK